MEFCLFDTLEVGDKSYEVKGVMRRFVRSPNSIALHAERELPGSFETRTGTPTFEGAPYEAGEGKRLTRQIVQFSHLDVQSSPTIVLRLEPSEAVGDREGNDGYFAEDTESWSNAMLVEIWEAIPLFGVQFTEIDKRGRGNGDEPNQGRSSLSNQSAFL